MRGFRVPAGLSGLVIVRKVSQRFGLLGFARLVKLLELVADAATVPVPGAALLAWGDVLQGLECGNDDAAEFLTYLEHAQVLERRLVDGRARLELRGELAAMLVDGPAAPPSAPVLFTHEQQWVDWFLADFVLPPYMASDAGNRQLYRRWVATNVTVGEVEEAVQMAVEASQEPSPVVLHEYLRTVRANKIERARA